MTIKFEQSFELADGNSTITFSVFDDELLFVHSDFTSSQFVLDEFGVQIMYQGKSIQVALMFNGRGINSQNYFSLFFRGDQYDALINYFRRLGYPCPETPTPMSENNS